MLTYLEKFNKLPQYLRDNISDSKIMEAVKDLEEKYDINLATLVIKLMVKDISILDLSKFFIFEYKIDGITAEKLVNELKTRVLFSVSEHIGFESKENNDSISVDDTKKEDGIKSSGFFFSAEDEEEVKTLAKKMGPKSENEKSEEDIDSYINQVIFETGVSFSSSDLSMRFIKVLKTYGKSVRNRIDTKITLTKEVGNGGLGMSNDRADEILKSFDTKAKKEREALFQKPKMDLSKENNRSEKSTKSSLGDMNSPFSRESKEKLVKGARDLDYDLSSMPNKAKNKEIKTVVKEPELFEKSNSKKTPLGEQKDLHAHELKDKSKEVVEPKKLDDHLRAETGKFKARIAVNETGKKKIEDVKKMPKLMGPVDELRYMNFIDFRRLDMDPMRAAAKIKSKIDVLEEDSFSRRLEGLSAWRESKIYLEYIDIGRKALGQNKSIEEVITDKKKVNQKTLSKVEFDAILNLNKELRFF